MARKVGFGEEEIDLPPQKGDLTRSKVGKKLIALALIEAVGVAIVIRGVLTGSTTATVIGFAWVVLVSFVTLSVVLRLSGLRKRQQRRGGLPGSWRLEDDSEP
jgi:hypothetical protein